MRLCVNFYTYIKLKHNGIWGWSIYGSNGWDNYGKVSYRFWEICSKITDLQGSTLSGHHMTTGFSPCELPWWEKILTTEIQLLENQVHGCVHHCELPYWLKLKPVTATTKNWLVQ